MIHRQSLLEWHVCFRAWISGCSGEEPWQVTNIPTLHYVLVESSLHVGGASGPIDPLVCMWVGLVEPLASNLYVGGANGATDL